jgi:hypothetical protein
MCTWYTLQTVDNEIQFALVKQSLELMGPQSLCIELVQSSGLVVVAHGAHGVDLILAVGPCLAQLFAHDVRLHSCEHRLARANLDRR